MQIVIYAPTLVADCWPQESISKASLSRSSLKAILACMFIFFAFQDRLQAQKTVLPPLPVEVFLGNDRMGIQMVVKKKFTPQSKFGFFSVSTYTASYQNELSQNEIIMPVQVNYTIGKGFGIMAGTTINARSGFAPVIGPQHNYSSKTMLAVTVASFYLNSDRNVQLFGLYEYKPPITEKVSLYSRIQFIYIHGLKHHSHERSYGHLRLGLKRKAAAFGVGANFDNYGGDRQQKENYGLFFRWDFL